MSTKKRVVLLAEDDAFARDMIRIMLRDVVTELVEADTGDKALEEFEKCKPDLVLLDIHLPGINGKELLQAMLQMAPNTYILMLSSDSAMDNVKETIQSGAKGFVAKPFNKESLFKYMAKCSVFSDISSGEKPRSLTW